MEKMQLLSLPRRQRLREVNLSKVIWLIIELIKPPPIKTLSPISPYMPSDFLALDLFRLCTFQADFIDKNVQWDWKKVGA